MTIIPAFTRSVSRFVFSETKKDPAARTSGPLKTEISNRHAMVRINNRYIPFYEFSRIRE
jgi:hypothetical protein